MANILRTIQLKRNHNAWATSDLAKQTITNISQDLKNGEIVLGSYTDEKAVNNVAVVLGIKANNNMFFVDAQAILNKLGINHDGSDDPSAPSDTIVKEIQEIINNMGNTDALIEAIIEACGLEDDGTYHNSTNEIISAATSLADADDKLAEEILDVEHFVGMDGSSGSLLTKITELSGKSITQVENTNTVALSAGTADDGTKKMKADVKLSTYGSESSATTNIILEKTDGVYASVHYDALTNALVINGRSEMLMPGSLVDEITYDSGSTKMIIKYHNASGGTDTVEIDLSNLVDVYTFPAMDENHNVRFTTTTTSSGTTVQADVDLIDCGEYN